MEENTKEVGTKALSIIDQAKSVKVVDSESYTNAAIIWKQVCAMIEEVNKGFDGNIKRWHEGHKAAIADKAVYFDPLNGFKKSIKIDMEKWDAEQARKAKEEEDRLTAIAKKEAEERQIADALAAAESGDIEESEMILNEPTPAPQVIVKKDVPKISGGPVFREMWSAECFDIVALCKAIAEGKASKELVMPNGPALNKLATALKSTLNIPGVRAVSRRV